MSWHYKKRKTKTRRRRPHWQKIDGECANCKKRLAVEEHDTEMFCRACQRLALKILRHQIQTVPMLGPLIMILCEGKFAGVIAAHVDPPIVSLNDHFVARGLRQGRMIEGGSK